MKEEIGDGIKISLEKALPSNSPKSLYQSLEQGRSQHRSYRVQNSRNRGEGQPVKSEVYEFEIDEGIVLWWYVRALEKMGAINWCWCDYGIGLKTLEISIYADQVEA